MKKFIVDNFVAFVAFLAALLSVVFVKTSRAYFSYIDMATLLILYFLMVVVFTLNDSGAFFYISNKIIRGVRGKRDLFMALIFLCFFSAMVITNDVALIAFVPFSIVILKACNLMAYLPLLVSLETIGANLGSSLTPIGNPQNIYLYNFYGFSAGEFFKTTGPLGFISFILLLVASFFLLRIMGL